MVLVDSSVWIRSLRNTKPFAPELKRLLEAGEVVGHDFIFGELLIGDRSGRAALLNEYARMPQLTPVPHREIVSFVRTRRLAGRGAGWIDIHLLASAIVGRVGLWTADYHLAVLAAELGVGYSIPSAHPGD